MHLMHKRSRQGQKCTLETLLHVQLLVFNSSSSASDKPRPVKLSQKQTLEETIFMTLSKYWMIVDLCSCTETGVRRRRGRFDMMMDCMWSSCCFQFSGSCRMRETLERKSKSCPLTHQPHGPNEQWLCTEEQLRARLKPSCCFQSFQISADLGFLSDLSGHCQTISNNFGSIIYHSNLKLTFSNPQFGFLL